MKQILTYPKYKDYTLFVVISLIATYNTLAQLKPVNAAYYANEFLMNPAMAGREELLNASIGFRQQLSSITGAPQTQFLTADYGFDAKSGVGLKVYSDKAGLLRETSVAATYAYHLPLGDESHLNFGIAATFTNNRLNHNLLNGDMDDPDAMDVNRRNTYIDSDFGLAYTSAATTLQAVFPNMVANLKKDKAAEVDHSLFFAAASYRFITDAGKIEPKLVYRGIKGFKNIVDVATNFSFQSGTKNQLNIMGIYHSSKNATFGFGITHNDHFSFNSSYTMGSSQIRSYTIGDLEIGIALKL